MNDRYGEVVTALGHELRLLHLGTGRWRHEFLDEVSDRKWPVVDIHNRLSPTEDISADPQDFHDACSA